MNDQIVNIKSYHQAVLMRKGDEFAVLALTRSTSGVLVLGRSQRGQITHSIQTEGMAEARRSFDGSLQASVDAGWSVAWRGFPFGQAANCGRCGSVRSANPEARFCGHCGGRLDA